MSQYDVQIIKLKKQIINLKGKEKSCRKKIEDYEIRLSKLKRSLDEASNNFTVFDDLNKSMTNLTQLRFVTSWVESRAQANKAEKNKTLYNIEKTYDSVRKDINSFNRQLEDIISNKKRLEVRLKELEKKKNIEENAGR